MARFETICRTCAPILLATTILACRSGGDVEPTEVGPPPVGAAVQVQVDLSTPTGLDASEAMRPGVTAYLVHDWDRAGILDGFLADFDGRVGLVLYDALDWQLYQVAPEPGTEDDLTARLNDVDREVGAIVAAGGTALIAIKCPMPDFLSSRQGADHEVLSGEPTPSDATVSGCSPVRDDPAARAAFTEIMEQVGRYFSRYGDQVVYQFGGEPENFFVGTADEMFDTYGLAASGLMAGHPDARFGGITSVGLADHMSKASATYDPSSDRWSYEEQRYEEPLLQMWVDYAVAHDIPIDFLTLHTWNPSARPRQGAWFETMSTRVARWLTEAGYEGRPTTLLPTDFAGWENACVVTPDGGLSSYYDSEYLAAMFVDHAIATLEFSETELDPAGPVRGVDLVYGYLMDLRAWTSCLPNASDELGGYPGMVTSHGVPKASYNALHLMTRLRGELGFPVVDDPAVAALSSYQADEGRVAVLMSRHIPSELHYVASGGGYPGYSFGSLFRHEFGFEPSPLQDEEPSPLMGSYLGRDDFPRSFVHDLLAEPAVFEVESLGLSPNWEGRLTEARRWGRTFREESAVSRRVELQVDLEPGTYLLETHVVDSVHANVNADRDSLQSRVDAAGNDPAALAALVTEGRGLYGPAATASEPRTLEVTGGTATVEIEMRPNSVWLVVLTPTP